MPVLYACVAGAWVPVGGAAADEVQVGPTAPVDSAVELWYDTSAVTVGAGLAGSGTEALKPATPSTPGFQYFATDTKRLWLWDGTGWIIMAEPSQVYVPTISAASGTITTVGAVSFRYRRCDGWLSYQLSIQITTAGSGATLQTTMPVTPRGVNGTFLGSGRESAASGWALQAQWLAPNMQILKYDNANTIVSGYAHYLTGEYEMTSRYS